MIAWQILTTVQVSIVGSQFPNNFRHNLVAGIGLLLSTFDAPKEVRHRSLFFARQFQHSNKDKVYLQVESGSCRLTMTYCSIQITVMALPVRG